MSDQAYIGRINEINQYQQSNFKPFFDVVNFVEGKNFQDMKYLESQLSKGY